MASVTEIPPATHHGEPPHALSASRPPRPGPASLRVDEMSRLARMTGILIGWADLALKRILHHPALTGLALLGLVLAIGLVTSAGFFSQAVDKAILLQELNALSQVTGRPPFSTRVYFFPSPRKPLSLEAAERAGQSVAETLSSEVGLPLEHWGIQVESGSMMLQPTQDDTRWGGTNKLLATMDFAYIVDVAGHMELVAGDPIDDGKSEGVLDVWMHARAAEKMGVLVGEEFHIAPTMADPPIRIRVRGIWKAADPKDTFWFNDPDANLADTFLVRRQDYIDFVEPMVPSKTRFAAWHIVLDDRWVVPSRARQYVRGFERGVAIINKYLPDARLDVSPLEPLTQFVQRNRTLMTTLLGFNVPALGFLIYYLILTAATIAQWQRRETGTLVSRGMSMWGVLGLTTIEQLLLFVVGVPLGIGFGMWIARMMSYTESFLRFTPREPLPVSLYGMDFTLIFGILTISLIARVLPAVSAARHSAVEHDRERARPVRGPFWYRAYLDLLLVGPTIYLYRQLASRGTLSLLVQDRPEEIYSDPLLILVPALFVLSAALLTMRLFPLIMRLFDRIASLAPWVTPHLALRQLGRQHQSYINPLLLVIISLALGIYSLSMAASLDQWLIDRIYYSVGADISFEPSLAAEEAPSGIADWIPLPGEFLDIPGVRAATRVGDYPASLSLADLGDVRARFLGIDRVDFPQVAWFRPDFAPESLGALMNRLAIVPDGILVPQDFLEANHLQIGDKVTMRIAVDEDLELSTSFTVVGIYRYFPTVYEDRLTVIGNLEHIFSFFGGPVTHRIWLATAPDADGAAIKQAIPSTGVEAIRWRDARAMIAEEQAKMERVGVFGTLSVGFLAAATMAVLGLLVHSYASLQERLYRFAVLRAIGLTRRQVVGQVIMEYGILTAYGALAGAGIGAMCSQLFAPLFRITGEREIPLPPLIPVIANDQISLLALSFAAAMVLLEAAVIATALYRRLFEAVRLGQHG